MLVIKQKTKKERERIMNLNDQRFLAERIRTQYVGKTSTELDALRALDKKVKRPANIFSYVFGSIGAVIMGSGMSLVMTDIAATIGIPSPMALGIVVGVIGLAMAVVNYPIYKGILTKRKQKYASEILSLSEKIMKQEGGEA